jgi:hypothetical protein
VVPVTTAHSNGHDKAQIVILSGAGTSRSEALAESKDPYTKVAGPAYRSHLTPEGVPSKLRLGGAFDRFSSHPAGEHHRSPPTRPVRQHSSDWGSAECARFPKTALESAPNLTSSLFNNLPMGTVPFHLRNGTSTCLC